MQFDVNKIDVVDTGAERPERHFRPLLYIAGPMLSEGSPYQNVGDACELAAIAYEKGWAPVVPHLMATMDMVVGECGIDYLEIDFALLAACSAVCVLPFKVNVLPDGTFSGTGLELNLADELCKPVYTEETLPYVN